jgi:hypothetical protein
MNGLRTITYCQEQNGENIYAEIYTARLPALATSAHRRLAAAWIYRVGQRPIKDADD